MIQLDAAMMAAAVTGSMFRQLEDVQQRKIAFA
jgi:hypothetical protein